MLRNNFWHSYYRIKQIDKNSNILNGSEESCNTPSVEKKFAQNKATRNYLLRKFYKVWDKILTWIISK